MATGIRKKARCTEEEMVHVVVSKLIKMLSYRVHSSESRCLWFYR